MERLWAPWRMEYIEGMGKEEKGCIFCTSASEDRDTENFILYRGKTVFIILNTFPYTNGHLLVAPYRHTADLTDLQEGEARELLSAATLGIKALRRAMSPDGFNLGINLSRTAGAGIADHLHLHIVPRWTGDTNFMSVCGEAKVIPEALPATLDRLRQAISTLESDDA
ncbi:MAG: HIT domain-containing protein [Armatimonadetes bacterium]|nr:HIT domain-containing protein [Armatimonadota bacterium]NIM23771.1 HIT domain-containing protein [Armatimonadota bacterium]NIM67648.1 HIT domain-containing protein [Armatimonadota bacterium]NIM76164.1 HIT domain-containing protein [Armatimonadota bacterium]NIN05849.1 HIT domain-containing protein [Armatimonadota bacterium]